MTLLDDFRLATSLNLMRLAMWRLRRRGEPLAWLDEATTHDDPYPLYERLRGGDTFHSRSSASCWGCRTPSAPASPAGARLSAPLSRASTRCARPTSSAAP